MRKSFSLLLSALLVGASLTGVVQAQTNNIIAFPGAEGGGKFATGGRGGEVYYVTNLNDSGEGSFREAVGTSNRIVVFEVGGTIELKSDVVVKSNVTVAGQTAPGGAGITLKNYKIGLGGENIILRFISSRPGERGVSKDYDAFGGSSGSNSIVDHCSIGWANDEQWGLYSKNDNATTQWSIIGPSNSFSYHSKGIHGFGVMFGRSNHTMHHNMIVHNISRNFRGKVVGEGVVDFVNNVIYNWGYETAYGTIGHLNYAGNYLKMGPSTKKGYNYVNVDSTTSPENFKIYLDSNRMVDVEDNDYETLSEDNWTGITYGSSNGRNEENVRVDEAFEMIVNGENVSVATEAESAEMAYDHVLQYAGAGINALSRPAIDQTVMDEAATGTGSLTGARPYEEANESQKITIDTYNIACGVEYEYPEPILEGAPLDTDRDGMPDEWESARGLNPYNKYASDGVLESSEDYCGQGYTNIEYYINDLTVDAFPVGAVTVSPTVALPGFKIDLQQNELVHTSAINSHINLINQADDVFDLSQLKLRYYYTEDNTGEQNIEIDDASITYEDDPWYVSLVEGIDARVVEMDHPMSIADSYVEISFTTAADIRQGSNIKLATRIVNSEWNDYDQSNDYSFGHPEHLAIFYDDILISGRIPE